MNEVQQLRDILGTESGNAWLDFMDYAHEVLAGIVDSRGKPTKEAIENSIIGEAGFDSWKGMIEAPVAAGGLGWNNSAWDSWKRAYRVVLAHPYLRDMELSTSQINTVHRETKDSEEGFPANTEAMNAYLNGRAADIADRQANSLADAKKRINELELALSTLTSDLENSSKVSEQLAADLATSKQSITELAAKYASLRDQAIAFNAMSIFKRPFQRFALDD